MKSDSNNAQDAQTSRRRFLTLGAAVLSATAAADYASADDDSLADRLKKKKRPPQGIDMEKWKRLKGEDYPDGSENTPGVCKLPGPNACLLYTSPSPRDATLSRMPSSA